MIPFVDLKAQYRATKLEIDAAIASAGGSKFHRAE
jgi:hypothetical protein